MARTLFAKTGMMALLSIIICCCMFRPINWFYKYPQPCRLMFRTPINVHSKRKMKTRRAKAVEGQHSLVDRDGTKGIVELGAVPFWRTQGHRHKGTFCWNSTTTGCDYMAATPAVAAARDGCKIEQIERERETAKVTYSPDGSQLVLGTTLFNLLLNYNALVTPLGYNAFDKLHLVALGYTGILLRDAAALLSLGNARTSYCCSTSSFSDKHIYKNSSSKWGFQ